MYERKRKKEKTIDDRKKRSRQEIEKELERKTNKEKKQIRKNNMKFISWNVNGLRACVTKGFKESFKALDADFFCLQETKMQEGQLDLQFEGYQSFWNYA